MTAAEVPAAGTPSGAIHDIGYRHYDGPRLGVGYTIRTLYADTLKGAFGIGRSGKAKVLPMLLLAIACIPPFVNVVITVVTSGTELALQYSRLTLSIQLVLAIYVAAQAPQCVSRDLRFRTTTLYFSRPLRRQDYVLAKFAAMTSAVLIMIALPLTILYVGALLAKLPFWLNTRGFLAALVAAVLLALLLAGISLVLASVTPRRGIGVATIMAVLLLATAVQGIIRAIAEEQRRPTVEAYASLLSPATLVQTVQDWLLRTDLTDVVAPGSTVGTVHLLVTLAVIAGSYGLLLLRYRKVSAS